MTQFVDQVSVSSTASATTANDTTVNTGQANLTAPNATTTPLTISLAASQSVPALTVKNSSGTTVAEIDQAGNLTAASLSPTPAASLSYLAGVLSSNVTLNGNIFNVSIPATGIWMLDFALKIATGSTG